MKILHVVAGDLNSGAARGAVWLHEALLKTGVDSNIISNSVAVTNKQNVVTISNGKFSKFLTKLREIFDQLPLIAYQKRKNTFFSSGLFGFNIQKHPAYLDADIIHLHWVNNGFLKISDIKKIKKPLVWTLRDMWPLTGGCHYALECEKFKSDCGSCPQLGSKTNNDLSKFLLNKKVQSFPKNCTVIGISNWISNEAISSKVFKHHKVQTIFNAVDTEAFKPIDKKNAKEILELPDKSKIILVGAQKIDDFYKGYNQLIEALSILSGDDYLVCFFGEISPAALKKVPKKYRYFGFLNDTLSLRLLYSAADVFVFPSLMEAFGKTCVEAMSCETPVVCFNATGPADIVIHKTNGYSAMPYDYCDLATGIDWVCKQSSVLDLGIQARKRVTEIFDSKVIAQQYKKVYEEKINMKIYKQK